MALGLSLTPATLAGADNRSPGPDAPVSDPAGAIASEEPEVLDEAFEVAVEQYAKHFGVSMSVATKRIHEQGVASEVLRRIKADPDVVEATLHHTKRAVELVVVHAPNASPSSLRRAAQIDADELGVELKLRTVPAAGTKKQVGETRRQVEELLAKEMSGSWGLYVDPMTGELVVSTDPKFGEDRVRAKSIVSEVFSTAGLVSRGTFTEAAVADMNQAGGGERMTMGGGACTSGFAVRRWTGPAIMTAGHCQNTNVTLTDSSGAGGSNVSVALDNATLDGYWSNRDTQFHQLTGAGNADPAVVVDAPSVRTAMKRTQVVGNGAWICQFGRSTNLQRCGSVINANHTSDPAGHPILTGMLLTTANVSPGDSGGPVFIGDRAVGVLSRGSMCILADASEPGGCRVYTRSVITPIGRSVSGTGYSILGPGNASRYTPTYPSRIYNTIVNSSQHRLIGGSPRRVKVRGLGGVPDHPNVTAVELQIATIDPSGAGFLRVYPRGSQLTVASAGNFASGGVVAHNITIALDDTDDDIIVRSSSSTDIVVDVLGYYRSDSGSNRTTLLNTPVRATGTTSLGVGDRTVTLPVQVPHNAVAVIANVTNYGNTVGTHITADHPNGATPPAVTTVNASSPNQTIGNQAIIRVKSNGTRAQLKLYNAAGTTNVALDIVGYIDQSSPNLYTPLQPTRLVDTRTNHNSSGALAPNSVRTIQIANLASNRLVPQNATGVKLRVTGIAPSSATHLTVSRNGSTSTATLNLAAGEVRGNTVSVPLNSGAIKVFNAAGYTHIVVDIEGYFYDG